MKIVYLNGPYRRQAYSRCSRSPAVTKSGTIYYPIWLAYAAGLARQQTDFDVELIDAVAGKYDRLQLQERMIKAAPDLVFCDTSTPSINEDVATAGDIKQVLPACRVVMVGTHATALPEEVLGIDERIDAVAHGEYDLTAIEMARALSEGRSWESLAGVCCRRGNQLVKIPARRLIENLDEFPFVSQVYNDFLEAEDYFFAAAQYPMTRGARDYHGLCPTKHRAPSNMRSPGRISISPFQPFLHPAGAAFRQCPSMRRYCLRLSLQKL